jgi:hypothetical protein
MPEMAGLQRRAKAPLRIVERYASWRGPATRLVSVRRPSPLSYFHVQHDKKLVTFCFQLNPCKKGRPDGPQAATLK